MFFGGFWDVFWWFLVFLGVFWRFFECFLFLILRHFHNLAALKADHKLHRGISPSSALSKPPRPSARPGSAFQSDMKRALNKGCLCWLWVKKKSLDHRVLIYFSFYRGFKVPGIFEPQPCWRVQMVILIGKWTSD